MESIKRKELFVGQEMLGAREEEGCMWLILAAKQGHFKRVQKFVAHGVNVNAIDKTYLETYIKNGSTALIEAASEGHDEIVNFLLTNGAHVDQTDKHELTALMCACMSGHIEVACLLVQADADLNLTDMSGMTALLQSGMTALDLALENDHLDLLKAVAALGVNIGSINGVKPEDTVIQKTESKLSWLGEVLTQRCISPDLVRLCEEKLVLQEGFGSPLTLTRTSNLHFHRDYLASLGITALGLCETLLTLHADLQSEFNRELCERSGVGGGPEAAARAAVKVVMVDYTENDASWGKVEETVPR